LGTMADADELDKIFCPHCQANGITTVFRGPRGQLELLNHYNGFHSELMGRKIEVKGEVIIHHKEVPEGMKEEDFKDRPPAPHQLKN
jgi:hypothetical protein